MRMVRVTLAVSSIGAGLLYKNMLPLPPRVWAFLSLALCSILEAGGGARRLLFQSLCCSDSGFFFILS